jgi:hypothetical protein
LNKKLIAIEDAAANLLYSLEKDSLERFIIEENVRAIAGIMGILSEAEIQSITRKLEERFNIRMSLGTIFSAENYRPWLDKIKGEIDWYYWNRYERYLHQGHYPSQVIRSLNDITDQILDHLEDPNKPGQWARKGMVVGHVQSGKTANYIGLINKAADAGYKVIIILAGTLNSLRNQTQYRIDNGFIGRDTENKMVIGVGLLDNDKKPAYFTTNSKDFKKSVANQIGVGIGDLKEPVVLVIKKNKTTLENLIDWLKNNNRHKLKNYPMLLIDDEADQASINTNKEGDLATAINRKIRQLLHLFERSSYVGYTATPFANVFIDPDTEDEMLGDDLFPRDFILSLDPPDNYIGSSKIFSTEKELDIVRIINDYETWFPLKHKKDFQPSDLPDSMKEAIIVFILSRAIRLQRGQKDVHNSMLINSSRFTKVQSNTKLLVEEFLTMIRQAIINNYRLTETEALKNPIIHKIKSIFEKEFFLTSFEWHQIQTELKNSVSPIGVIEVNSSSTARNLNYSRQDYPEGRNVIAIGGLSLSRGLTLEGLTVSYFLRNSIMYDTLMQMGRWFGYRDGYADLCRIYMTAEAESWYGHISDATDELREEFRRMKLAGMSPKDFGLCIRSHPESLIVTARNKMRSGKYVTRGINLEGRLVETSILLKKPSYIQQNFRGLEDIVQKVNQFGVRDYHSGDYFWRKVPSRYVSEFVDGFQNHPASQLTDNIPLKEYINWLESNGKSLWDVVLVTLKKSETNLIVKIENFEVVLQKRSVTEFPDKEGNGIAFSKRRLASRGLEKIGLSENEIKLIGNEYLTKNIPDHAYRRIRKNPLLMLHLIDCQIGDNSLFESGIVAYGISFPGVSGTSRPEKLIEYVVNTTWWRNEYQEFLEEIEEEDDY